MFFILCYPLFLCSRSLMHKIQENTSSVTDKFYHLILCHILCAFYIGRYKSKLPYLTWSGFEPKIHHTRGSMLTISLVMRLQPLCIFTLYSSCLQFLTGLHTIWGTGVPSWWYGSWIYNQDVSHWQTLLQSVVSSTSCHKWDSNSQI
jgi:hypothetical protein